MDSLSTPALAAIALVVALVIAAAVYLVHSRRETRRLQQRFGAEYPALVKQLGSRSKAEAELKRREKRVERFRMVDLSPAEVSRFRQGWARLQASFVDDPKGVLIEADRLVRELMLKRGYPMADFELRAADLSVDHAGVVDNYRAAQRILSRDQRGEADTEELRRAVVHFRALFDELLGATAVAEHDAPATRLAA